MTGAACGGADEASSGDGADAGAPGLDFEDPEPLEEMPLSAGSCAVGVTGDDVYLSLSSHGVTLDARLGSAGVISELADRETGLPLLSPPFAQEMTDRVIQWSFWSSEITNEIPGNDHPGTFNVTQAGSFGGSFNPTLDVHVDPGACRIDVWSRPTDQWDPEQWPSMQGGMVALTRYDMIGEGYLLIRRVLRLDRPTLHGDPLTHADAMLDTWTPMRRGTFDALAFGFAADGSPEWWYRSGENIPTAPLIFAHDSNGYGAVFDHDEAAKPAFGVAFGKNHPCQYTGGECTRNYITMLNSMEWDTGIAILPNVKMGDVEEGDIIDQTILIAASRGPSADYTRRLEAAAALVPPPRLFKRGDRLDPTLEALRSELEARVDRTGVRTDHLGPLVQ